MFWRRNKILLYSKRETAGDATADHVAAGAAAVNDRRAEDPTRGMRKTQQNTTSNSAARVTRNWAAT